MSKKIRYLLIAGFLSGGLAVILGAFGAHMMHETLVRNGRLETYRTAVTYQFVHSMALILTAILYHFFPSRLIYVSALLFLAGIVLFSGSLYILSFNGNIIYGILTPAGGLCFISAWLLPVLAFIKKQ